MKDFTLNPRYPLLNEQNEIIEFMLKRPCAICGAQTGLGKTLTMCTALIYLLKQFPDTQAVCIVPQKAVKAFKKELTQKLNVPYSLYTSSQNSKSPRARIHIITQSSLKKYLTVIPELRKQGRLIGLVDEIHCLQNPDSALYQQIQALRKYFAVFWGLTATSLKNDIMGFYHMMDLMKQGVLGSQYQFESNFLITRKKKIKNRVIKEIVGYRNMDKLKALTANYIIIKQKKYNLEFHYHQTKMNDVEKKRYLMAGKGLLSDSAEKHYAVRLHDLQKVVDNVHPEYDRIPITQKETLCLQIVKNSLSTGNPCLVYCSYYDTLFRLKDLLKHYSRTIGMTSLYEIHGQVPQAQREAVEDKITTGSVVLVTDAGSESVNLQKANSIIFYDIPFSISVFTQMVGRVTRVDSKFDKQFIHLIEAKGTIDTYKRILVQMNSSLIEQLFESFETLPTEVLEIDKNVVVTLRRSLLWGFQNPKYISDEYIKQLLNGSGSQ